jgi:hypothetical protein
MELNKSILESEYIEQSRPYSQNELKYLRENLYKNLRLGKQIAVHSKCRHFYYVKENSRKEKEILEKNTTENVGNCSVCWKLNKTSEHLKDKAWSLVETYSDTFYKEPKNYIYDLLDLETIFYKWLYYDSDKYNENDKYNNKYNGKYKSNYNNENSKKKE